MKADTKIVLKAVQKFVVLALLATIGGCLLLLDVLVFHTGIRESSLTEIGQELVLFAIAVTFWLASRREGYSGFCILVGGLFGCMAAGLVVILVYSRIFGVPPLAGNPFRGLRENRQARRRGRNGDAWLHTLSWGYY